MTVTKSPCNSNRKIAGTKKYTHLVKKSKILIKGKIPQFNISNKFKVL
jgi:hypothetical protein